MSRGVLFLFGWLSLVSFCLPLSVGALERPPLDRNAPEKTEVALFALGWFWGVDSRFGSLDGVVRTTAGYAGGEEPDPSYRRMKDHTETVRVEFDPRVISYRQLLDLFWNSHDASNKVHSRQYRNAVFYTSEAQRQAAQADKQRLQEMKKRPVHTAIERAGAFYPAEDYHQKYYLRRYDQLLQELRRFYATEEALAASTAAARLNGYLGCHGQPKQLTEEIGRLGLSLEAQHYLLDYVKNGCRGFASIRCALPPLDAGDKEQRMGSRE